MNRKGVRGGENLAQVEGSTAALKATAKPRQGAIRQKPAAWKRPRTD
jgi:hypothetical protein